MTFHNIQIDQAGRIYLPTEVRRALKVKKGGLIRIEVIDERCVLTKGQSIATESRGIFKKVDSTTA